MPRKEVAKSPKRQRKGEITLKPPILIPMTEEQYAAAVEALADLLQAWFEEHPERLKEIFVASRLDPETKQNPDRKPKRPKKADPDRRARKKAGPTTS